MTGMMALLIGLVCQSPVDLGSLGRQIVSNPAEASRVVRTLIPANELAKGATPVTVGTTVLFALQLDGAKKVNVEAAGFKSSLTALENGLFASVVPMEDGAAHLVKYVADGREIRTGLQVEVYQDNPFVLAPPGGRRGELREMGVLESKAFPNTTRKWYVYLPPGVDSNSEYPVLVAQDAQWDRDWIANALENCAAKGMIPKTVGIFIEPGQDRPGNYSNRSVEYDTLSPRYVNFVLEEILPKVEAIVKLTGDPAKRAICGMSSGGICSFTACWERPDKFGVAMSFIGSFTNIASGESKREGGHNYPFLIRKLDKKPIRVFLQDGSNDLDNQHGSWWISNLQMDSALKFKGYDYRWVPGKGFHNTKHARRIFDQVLTWWLGKP